MDVVAHLLGLVAEDGVRGTGRARFDEIREKAVQLGAGVIRSGQTSAAEAGGLHAEVAPVS